MYFSACVSPVSLVSMTARVATSTYAMSEVSAKLFVFYFSNILLTSRCHIWCHMALSWSCSTALAKTTISLLFVWWSLILINVGVAAKFFLFRTSKWLSVYQVLLVFNIVFCLPMLLVLHNALIAIVYTASSTCYVTCLVLILVISREQFGTCLGPEILRTFLLNILLFIRTITIKLFLLLWLRLLQWLFWIRLLILLLIQIHLLVLFSIAFPF